MTLYVLSHEKIRGGDVGGFDSLRQILNRSHLKLSALMIPPNYKDLLITKLNNINRC